MPTAQETLFTKEVLLELFASRIVKSRAVGLDGTRLEKFEDNIAYETDLIARKVIGRTYSFTTYREKTNIKRFSAISSSNIDTDC